MGNAFILQFPDEFNFLRMVLFRGVCTATRGFILRWGCFFWVLSFGTPPLFHRGLNRRGLLMFPTPLSSFNHVGFVLFVDRERLRSRWTCQSFQHLIQNNSASSMMERRRYMNAYCTNKIYIYIYSNMILNKWAISTRYSHSVSSERGNAHLKADRYISADIFFLIIYTPIHEYLTNKICIYFRTMVLHDLQTRPQKHTVCLHIINCGLTLSV